MLGMMQILTYLLCVYLVFKAIEIFQIAYVSNSEKRGHALTLGIVVIMVSVFVGIGFSLWSDKQAQSVSDNMQSLPRSVAPNR